MIKNFFVKTQSIKNKKKGLTNYINYLKNDKHSNHKEKTTRILPIYDTDFLTKTLKSIYQKDLDNKIKGKGGSSFQSYRQSFCFSFPNDIGTEILTDETLIKIYKNIIKDIFNKMDIPIDNKNLRLVFGNVHFNENIHINIVLPKVINEKTYDFSKKSLLDCVKKSFDNQCIQIGLDKKDYQSKPKPKTKSLEQYKMSLERKEVYLQLELEYVRLKKQKDEVINHKIENTEIKKEYYKSVNPFIMNIRKGLDERKKKTKTINIYEMLENVKTEKPNITKKYESVMSFGM